MLATAVFTALFVYVAAVHTTHHARGAVQPVYPLLNPLILKLKPDTLVQSLRKKLMNDNYDYVTGNTEDAVIFRADVKINERQENTSKVITYGVVKTTRKEKPREYNVKTNFYVSKLNVVTDNINKNEDKEDRKKESKVNERPDITVSRKDLLYYMDEEPLTAKKSVNNVDVTNYEPASVKYKVLKTKHKNYRRKGQTQYIQEESKDGFAIVKLGDGPFPALRLPPARRQYMRDLAEADSDEEEVPPPSVSQESTRDDKIPE